MRELAGAEGGRVLDLAGRRAAPAAAYLTYRQRQPPGVRLGCRAARAPCPPEFVGWVISIETLPWKVGDYHENFDKIVASVWQKIGSISSDTCSHKSLASYWCIFYCGLGHFGRDGSVCSILEEIRVDRNKLQKGWINRLTNRT